MMDEQGILDYVSCIFLGLNVTSINVATSCTMLLMFSLNNDEVLPYKQTLATCRAPKPHGSSMGREEEGKVEGRAAEQ